MKVKPKTHELKTVNPYFTDVVRGVKPFEVRLNDRDYQVGDILILQEYDLETGYTGKSVEREITYVLSDYPALKEGYVVLGLKFKF